MAWHDWNLRPRKCALLRYSRHSFPTTGGTSFTNANDLFCGLISATAINQPIADVLPCAVLSRMFLRRLFATLLIAVTGCSGASTSADFCQLPSHFQSWDGVEVKWHGSVIPTFHHGYILVADHCARSIAIDADESDAKTLAVWKAFRKNWTNKGLISATITGKLYKDGNVVRLKLLNLDGIVVRPLTETELRNWYSIKGSAILR